MHIKQLDAFRAVIVTGSLTNAAARQKVTQPTISRLLSDLEADLGFPLFSRKKGKIVPTEDGMAFFAQLEKVNDVLAGLRLSAEEIRRNRVSHLKIAATPALATFVLPKIAARFRQSSPQTALTIEAKNIPQLIDSVQTGQADLIFTHRVADIPGLIQKDMLETEFVCALPPGHRLAEKTVVEAADLVEEEVVKLEDPEDFDFASHDDVLGHYEWWRNARLRAKQSSVAYAYVMHCGAVGVVEPFSADLWRQGGIVIRPFRPAIRYRYTVVYPIVNRGRTAAMQFIEHLKAMTAAKLI